MTCIVGVVERWGDSVVLGADAAMTSNIEVDIQSTPKVWELFPGCIVGGAGTVRGLQLVRYTLSVKPFVKGDAQRWMIRTFVPALDTAYAKGGFTQSKEDGVMLLVGLKGQLFEIGFDHSVTETTRGYAALGAAYEFALGGITAVLDFNRDDLDGTSDARDLVLLGLHTAAAHCPFVSPPYTLITT